MSTGGALGGDVLRAWARPAWVPVPDLGQMLLVLASPLLRAHLALYRHHVDHSPVPGDAPITSIPGPTPDRVLFIGDLAAAGSGVLHHGMTTVCITAGKVASERLRGINWDTVTSPDLTLHQAAHQSTLPQGDVDVVVLLLGIPDVLLGTTEDAWTRDLHLFLDRIRPTAPGKAQTGPQVVIGAIPPMADFHPIHPVGRRLITAHVTRLNAASRQVAATVPGVTFVPFPTWRVGDMFIRDHLSWATMHRLWAYELAPHLTTALNTHPHRSAATPTR